MNKPKTQDEPTIFCGRLGADPELAYTAKRVVVCRLSLAINHGDKTTTWKKVVVWERQAELCKATLKKGHQLFVYGKANQKTFTNEEGKTVTYEEITAWQVGFVLGQNEEVKIDKQA